MENVRLHCLEAGRPDAPVLVLLHGFGGHAASSQPVIDRLGDHFHILAFDLPGHAGSLTYPGFGSPRTAALAVLSELNKRGIRIAHIAGHSMGGAVAFLMALEAPEVIASLTLIAPGGFGPEMDRQALHTLAEAQTAAELSSAYAAMMAPQSVPDPAMIARVLDMYNRPGQREALRQILARISRGNGQGELPLGALSSGRFPVSLLWGNLDTIVPFAQSANAPTWFRMEAIEGAGHMLLDEAPEAVARAILEQLQTI